MTIRPSAWAAATAAADADDAPLQLAPPPPAAPVFEHLPDVWVLELSSFQLDGAQGFEPSAAVVLNVTQDHLDWHGDMPAYAAAKARIYGKDAVMVINRDDVLVEKMVPAPIPDYALPGLSSASWATALAGGVGTVIVFVLSLALARVLVPGGSARIGPLGPRGGRPR